MPLRTGIGFGDASGDQPPTRTSILATRQGGWTGSLDNLVPFQDVVVDRAARMAATSDPRAERTSGYLDGESARGMRDWGPPMRTRQVGEPPVRRRYRSPRRGFNDDRMRSL